MDNNELQGELGWLYSDASAYRNSDNYRNFLEISSRLRRLSGFNTALVYTQMPGAVYYLTEKQWWRKHRRVVKTDERPLIALQLFAPIMLLYDYSQTKALGYSPNSNLDKFIEGLKTVPTTEGKKIDWEIYGNLIANLPNFGIDFSTMRTGPYYKGKLEIGTAADPQMVIK